MSGIGLTGTSGTGKTTLAVKVSELTGVPYVSSQARAAYAMFGIDPSNDQSSFDQRLAVQGKILDFAEAEYKAVGSLFITDRTPMDFAAYVLADVQRANLTDEQTDQALAYVERCYQLTNLYFSSLILIQPAIPFVERAARPSNKAYLEHVHILMTGLIADPNSKLFCAKHFLKKAITDLNRRVEVVIKIASLVEVINMKQRESAITH
ncbi:AAA family ATPase [Methylobacter sp.]